MSGAFCRTCLFWEEGGATLSTATRLADPVPDVGVCQRYPPQLFAKGLALHPISYWPETHAEQGCGEHLETPEAGGGEREPVEDDQTTVVPFQRNAA